MSLTSNLRALIRDIPDFPREGIVYKDIAPVLRRPKVFQQVVDVIAARFAPEKIDVVASIEARGFIFAAPLALKLNVPFIPIRKRGKLPHKKIAQEYQLEYGVDGLELEADALTRGERTLIVDDLLATGGTALAAAKLVEKLGGRVVSFAFLVQLGSLKGEEKLNAQGYNVFSLINYTE